MVHRSLSERIVDCCLGVTSRDEFGEDFRNFQATEFAKSLQFLQKHSWTIASIAGAIEACDIVMHEIVSMSRTNPLKFTVTMAVYCGGSLEANECST